MGLSYHEIIQSNILIYHTHHLQLCLPSIRDHGIIPICEALTNYSLILSTSHGTHHLYRVPSSTLWQHTRQWKMDLLKMYSLLKMGLFHCHVSLPECTPKNTRTKPLNPRTQPRCVSNNGCQDDWEAYSKFQAEVGDSVQPLG